jgi:hypothetical protein
MPQPTVAELWTALGRSRLVAPAALAALQREHGQRSDAAAADAAAVASWLVSRGVVTRWQAKRLLAGERGPYVLGDYRLLERREHPGGVPLFTARHEPSQRVVDLVLLSGRRCQDPAVWQGVVRRATSAIGATEPTLSRTWAVEEADGSRFIVCEHVTGTSLGAMLETAGPLSPREAGETVLRLARGVAAIHASGGVHGAVSLDTALRTEGAAGSGAAGLRLLQYPLVADPHLNPPRIPLATDDDLAKLGSSAVFVAPELTLPGASCTERSDVYALGAVLHALLTGQLPGWRGEPRATLRHTAIAGLPPLGPPVVPQEVATLVGYLTARDPQGRYPGAGEAADAIAACFGIEESALVTVTESVTGAAEPDTLSATTGAATSRRRPARRRSPLPAILTTGVLLGLAAVAGFVLDPFGMRSGPERPPASSATAPPPADAVAVESTDGADATPSTPADTAATLATTPAPSADAADGGANPAATVTLVADDALPWAAPTHGPPPTLAYLPGGSQLLLTARPAEIMAEPEGPLFIKALGPEVEAALAWLTSAAGCDLQWIESVQAGWQAAADGSVVGGCAIRLAEGHTVRDDAASRGRQWGTTETVTVAGASVHRAGPWAYWVPQAEQGRVLVVAPAAFIEEIVVAGDARPPLPRDVESLVDMLDAGRHLSIGAATHYLFTDGRGLLAGPLARLADPLDAFLGDGVRAAALAIHFGDSVYVELDAVGTLDAAAAGLAPALSERMHDLPAAVERSVASLAPHPHGRLLVMRLPTMLGALVAHLRAGAEGQGAVLNAYLPRHAGHNLALAAELLLAQGPGTATPLAQAGAAPATPDDVWAKLRRPLTIVFSRDTLEKSVQMVADEIGVPIEIIGPDLQLEGITKNQSFGLAERDQTADAILRVILAKSNPDGKLVYVVRQQGGVEKIEITTRAAAAKRGDTLPPGFEAAAKGTEETR